MRRKLKFIVIFFVSFFITIQLLAQTDSIIQQGGKRYLIIELPDVEIATPGDTSYIDTILPPNKVPLLTDSKIVDPDTVPYVRKWKKSIQTGLNINQSSFSTNWNAGGINTIAMNVFANGRLGHETKRSTFLNDVQLMYGIVKNEDLNARKNADRIFIDSKYGYKFSEHWNIFYSLNILSQFDQGYKFSEDTAGREVRQMISRFMAPGYLTSSVGIEYKPKDFFWLRFGAATLRQTFVLDTTLHRNEPQNYGVPIRDRVRSELAFQLVANFDKEVAKNLILKTRYMAFANYSDFAAMDHRFDLTFTAKVTKYININLTGALLYDQDIDYRIQYTQALAIAILFNYTEFDPK